MDNLFLNLYFCQTRSFSEKVQSVLVQNSLCFLSPLPLIPIALMTKKLMIEYRYMQAANNYQDWMRFSKHYHCNKIHYNGFALDKKCGSVTQNKRVGVS